MGCIYRDGDKVMLACSEAKFKRKVSCGNVILDTCFKDGVATISDNGGFLSLNSVSCPMVTLDIRDKNLKYIKPCVGNK